MKNAFDEIARKNCPYKHDHHGGTCNSCATSSRLAQAAVEATIAHVIECPTCIGINMPPHCQSDILRRTEEILKP